MRLESNRRLKELYLNLIPVVINGVEFQADHMSRVAHSVKLLQKKRLENKIRNLKFRINYDFKIFKIYTNNFLIVKVFFLKMNF